MRFQWWTSLALVALAGCGEATPPELPPEARVSTVRLRTGAPRVAPGDSLTIVAEPLDAGGRPVPGVAVTWGWSDSTALLGATEGATLRARAVRAAEVRVTARAGDATGTLEVTLRYGTPAALRLALAPGDSLVVGGSARYHATTVDSAGRTIHDQPPAVTVADTAVLSVRETSAGPLLTARRPGRTELVATLGALRTAVTVRVWPAPRYVWPDTAALRPGDTRRLRAQELPADARPTVLAPDRWLTSDVGVATVSAAGVVTAVAPGRAAVRAVVGADTLAPAVVVVRAPAPPVEYVAIASGAPCAVSRDGGIHCWGSGAGGQLGTTEPVDRCEDFQPWSGAGRQWYVRSVARCSALPVRVQSASRFVAAAGHDAGACGLTDRQTLECWGAVPTPQRRSDVPVPVAPELRVAQVEGRCLLTVDGAVYCWGTWVAPMWGDSLRSADAAPRRVPSPVPFRRIAVGGSHACGLTADGAVYCWGSNFAGEVGVAGSVQTPGCFTVCEPLPRLVAGLPPSRDVRPGVATTCALDEAGAVRCWGVTFRDGRATMSPTPVPLPGAPPLAALLPPSHGDGIDCGVTAAGEVWCWGRPADRAARPAAPAFPVRAATLGTVFGCAIGRDDARLTCWGHGLLGDGVFPEVGGFREVRVAGQRP